MRYWKPEDIFLADCPVCHAEIEFWKDEAVRICSACHREVRNPRIEVGCSQWCQHVPKFSGTIETRPKSTPKCGFGAAVRG